MGGVRRRRRRRGRRVLPLWRAGFFGNDVSTLGEALASLAKIGAFAALVWGAAEALGHLLVAGPGGPSAAVLQRSRDPLALVRRRFSRIVRAIGAPVAIFIDDLDRCQDAYIVELLEGIQTLFIDEPVVIVVSADAKWLSDAYAQVYRELAATAGEPGRPLGSLFLDKAFQHTVRLARIPDDVRERYWQRLLGAEPDPRSSDVEEHRKAASIFEGLGSAEEILTRLREEEAKGEVDSYALHLAPRAGSAAASSRSGTGTCSTTSPACSRTTRARSRSSSTPAGSSSRCACPLLADYLAAHPDDVAFIGDGNGDKPSELPDELAPLLRKAAVCDVVKGGNVTPAVELDADAITLFVGRGAGGTPA